jgi:serine O-acetyltransferase
VAQLFPWQSAIADDFRIIFERDPAARHWLEVLLCYPGFQCLLVYRLTHWLHQLNFSFLSRFLSHLARFLTGIDIHPGAVLGRGTCIDHGMGVVIGETAVVGDCALIYQGATLGGTGRERGKRHPTLGKNVVVGAGAQVLGNIQIGDNVRIGAGAVVLQDVPANCTVVGVPGRIVRNSQEKTDPLAHAQLPDVSGEWIAQLVSRLEQLEGQVQSLRRQEAARLEKSKI